MIHNCHFFIILANIYILLVETLNDLNHSFIVFTVLDRYEPILMDFVFVEEVPR